MARAMTSAARTIEQPASSIMSSLAQGLIADMSVGLIAVAVQKARERESANRGTQLAGTYEECCISGKTNAGFRSGWYARDAAPPRSRSQYQSAKAITFVAQTTPPAASRPPG